MASLHSIEISQLRNIQHAVLQLDPCFNLVSGLNGSGKTSLLEAIYLLGLGRSFRTRLSQKLIQQGADKLQVMGRMPHALHGLMPIGIEKTARLGTTHIRINHQDVSSATALAELLPLQLVYPDSYRLLDAGPRHRRQFIDWGLFHVEHSFLMEWQRLKQSLLQRNAALKKSLPVDQIEIWNGEFIEASEAIEKMRQAYFLKFREVFQPLALKMMPGLAIQLDYKQGWSEKLSLAEALKKNLRRDQELGYTQAGPHRSDLQFLVQGHAVHDILSRGQQKLLIYTLRLTQGLLLKQITGHACIYLLDDLLSELDPYSVARVLALLQEIKAQVVVTGVDLKGLVGQLEVPSKLFHVEQGVYREIAKEIAIKGEVVV